MLFLRYLYSIWAALLFILLMWLAVPFFFISSFFDTKTAARICIGYNRWWMYTWGYLTGNSFRTVDADYIQPNSAYVFVFNHVSAADAVVANACIPIPFMPMAKKEILKIPVMGYLFSKISIMVDRSSAENRKHSLEKMKENARNGISVMVFPEGTRNKDLSKPLGDFKAGAFITAIDAQLPIAPFVVVGGRHLLTNEKLPIRPTTFTAYYAPPIPTQGLTAADVDGLKAQTYALMEQLLIKHDPAFAHLINTANSSS